MRLPPRRCSAAPDRAGEGADAVSQGRPLLVSYRPVLKIRESRNPAFTRQGPLVRSSTAHYSQSRRNTNLGSFLDLLSLYHAVTKGPLMSIPARFMSSPHLRQKKPSKSVQTFA